MSRYRVRVWFGHNIVAHHEGDQASAQAFHAAMVRRFPSLDTTYERLPDRPVTDGWWRMLDPQPPDCGTPDDAQTSSKRGHGARLN